MRVAFEVEQAGCESCGKLVRAALAPLGAVESLTIDEQADMAGVVLEVTAEPEQSLIDEELAKVSAGAGHLYRVRAGSFARALTSDRRYLRVSTAPTTSLRRRSNA